MPLGGVEGQRLLTDLTAAGAVGGQELLKVVAAKHIIRLTAGEAVDKMGLGEVEETVVKHEVDRAGRVARRVGVTHPDGGVAIERVGLLVGGRTGQEADLGGIAQPHVLPESTERDGGKKTYQNRLPSMEKSHCHRFVFVGESCVRRV